MKSLPDRIADAVELIDDLIGVLEAETDAIRRHDIEAAGQLQSRKTALANVYMQDAAFLNQNRDEVRALGDDWLEALAEVRGRLDEAVRANMRAVEIGRSAAQRMFAIIRESARRAAGSVDKYTAGGQAAGDPSGSCVSVSYNGQV